MSYLIIKQMYIFEINLVYYLINTKFLIIFLIKLKIIKMFLFLVFQNFYGKFQTPYGCVKNGKNFISYI